MCPNVTAHREERKEDCHAMTNKSAPAATAAAAHHRVYYSSDDHGWIPARVKSLDEANQQALLLVDHYQDEQSILQCSTNQEDGTEIAVNLREYPNGVLPLQNTNESGELSDFEDMTEMPYLHEAGILYNLKRRHLEGKPYTRSGDVIVAMNPYHWYHHLYTTEEQQHYANQLLWGDLSLYQNEIETHTIPDKNIAPHVYETATLAYKGMALWNHSQSILVSGESGAGKTETVKIAMDHIATLQRGPPQPNLWENKHQNQVVDRILEAQPLLESFGNAQTRRNDNSSRFGKYACLQFDRQLMARTSSPARLVGSKTDVYLLEKNRVVAHDPSEERAFHIFYELLAAPPSEQASIWSQLKGASPDSFRYVGASSLQNVEGQSDGERFHQTLKNLGVVGIADQDRMDLFRSLCVVLQLGNLTFAVDPTNDDQSIITSQEELQQLASLMGLDPEEVGLALTERTMIAATDVYKVPLTAAEAKESCDGLAKDIYEKVFLWLVKTINQATRAEPNKGKQRQNFGTIGLLDISGFEVFLVNRFEQLCINYANEKLQAKFTRDCFKLVQAVYKEQQIPLENIEFDDNTDVLDLIEGKTGLLAMLNEECWRPQGNAATFVNKALHRNEDSPCLLLNTMDRLSFGIHHYAGKVLYDANDFITCNQDRLPFDLKECASKLSNSIVSNEYKAVLAEAQAQEEAGGVRRLANSNNNIMAKTVWTKYKSQLSQLMTDLSETESRYIRCIMPNPHKEALSMDHKLTIAQLRSCGIVASVTISRSAFPNRMDNKNVMTRFGGIWHQQNKVASTAVSKKEGAEKYKAEAEALLSFALKSKSYTDRATGKIGPAFVVGKTKTFFRAGALEYLEAERIHGLDQQASIIQRHYHAFLKQKQAILAARELRCRRAHHRRMAELRKAKQLAEEKARQEEAAREEEAFQRRMAEEWANLRARLDEEDRLLLAKLDEEEARQQAQLDAETKLWQEEMTRRKEEHITRLAKEREQWAFPAVHELDELQKEIKALRKRMLQMDRQRNEKLEVMEERYQQVLKEKRGYDLKDWHHGVDVYLNENEVKNQKIFAEAALKEREKQIVLLKREKVRLANVLEKTEQKKSAILESNQKLKKECVDKGATCEKTQQLNESMDLVIDEHALAYDAAKAENQVLHEEIAKEQEKFSVLTLCKLELQQTLTKILETVQSGSQDMPLREAVMKEIMATTRAAYKQMKVVKQLQEEARKSDNDRPVIDFNESWTKL